MSHTQAASIESGAVSFDVAYAELRRMRRHNVVRAAAVLKKLSVTFPHEAADWIERAHLSPPFAIAILEGLARAEPTPASAILKSIAEIHPHAGVRAAALNTIASRSPSDASGSIIAGLKDSAWEVRVCAAKSAGKLRVREAQPALLCLSQDPHWWVRTRAIEALTLLKTAATA